MSNSSAVADPTLVLDHIEAFRRSKTMFTGVALGIFDALADGAKSVQTLASELKANPSALERLLDACVGLQLLARRGDAYENTPTAQTYLTKASPRRLTGYITFSNDVLWKMWANLEDAVMEGGHRWKQVYGWDGPIFSNFFRDENAKREFLMGMNGMGLISSPQVVAGFDMSGFHTLVDLGGATGHLVMEACQRYPHLRGVLFDLPEAITLAQELVGASKVADRIRLVGGDFFKDPLPEGDLFALGRILHDWSEEKMLRLLTRIFDRLPSGGALLVAEKLLHENKDGPRLAQMQDLNMLIVTEGRERSAREYENILQKVGFVDIQAKRTGAPVDGLLARKK